MAQPTPPPGPGGPERGAAPQGDVVPQPYEPARRRKASGAGRRFPGAGEHHKPRAVCADRHALRPAQTPAAGGPRGSGECESNHLSKVFFSKVKNETLLHILHTKGIVQNF